MKKAYKTPETLVISLDMKDILTVSEPLDEGIVVGPDGEAEEDIF